MRKLIVGLMVGGLVAVGAPAMAQNQGGIGDPLTLAASGVVLPFFGGAGDTSLLEVASPVAPNLGVHMFFFDNNCTRVGDSVGMALTTNDIQFLTVTGPGGVLTSSQATSGLVTIATASSSGFELVPLDQPLHARMYWFNSSSGKAKIIEPIILDTAEFSGNPHTWSPLRRAATFYAPLEVTGTQTTTIYFICPKATIQTHTAGAFPGTSGFPEIAPVFPTGFSSDVSVGSMRARIYDTAETFLRDVHFGCNCVQATSVTGISNVYSNSSVASLGTFTEVESNATAPTSGDFAFTGFRSVTAAGFATDWFQRLSNGSRPSIQGSLNSQR